MHHGPVADSKTRACCAGVSAIPRCFLGTGGSLRVTGLLVTSPHFSARTNVAGDQTSNVPDGLRAQGPSLLCSSVMPTAL
jgi:hypothetical protein